MKKYLLVFLLVFSLSGYAQNTINNYKYVLVPEKFSFLKQKDQYRLNTLAKVLFEEKGFTVYYDDAEVPNDISNNRCSALNLDVLEKNSMFSTNLTLLLKDCKGNIIFKSKEGKSREKEYSVSYNLAFRDAFSSFNDVSYAYTGAATANEQQAATNANMTVPASQAAVQAPVVQTSGVQPSSGTVAAEATQTAGTLYAQPTANGYQLIDTAPKIIVTLFKTSVVDYFIAENGSANGIVFKKNGNWFFEYYKDGKLIAEKLLIKF